MAQHIQDPKNQNVTKGAMDEGLRRASKRADQEAQNALDRPIGSTYSHSSLSQRPRQALVIADLAYDHAIFLQQRGVAEK